MSGASSSSRATRSSARHSAVNCDPSQGRKLSAAQQRAANKKSDQKEDKRAEGAPLAPSDSDSLVDPIISAAALAANTAAAAAALKKGQQTSVSVTDASLVQALIAALHSSPQGSPRGSPTRAVISAIANAPRDACREKYAGEPGLALTVWCAKARRMLAFYENISDAKAVAWLATGLDGAAGDWFDEQSISKGQPFTTPTALFDDYAVVSNR